MAARTLRFLSQGCLAFALTMALAVTTMAGVARADTTGAPAVATDQAMAVAQRLATEHWGAQPCGGQVTISWTMLAPQVNATSTWSNPVDAYSDPAENSACSVAFNALASWDWPKLCTVVVHEFGHLTGHPHTTDPNDVMTPFYDKPLPACNTQGPNGPPVVTTATAPKTGTAAQTPPRTATRSRKTTPKSLAATVKTAKPKATKAKRRRVKKVPTQRRTTVKPARAALRQAPHARSASQTYVLFCHVL
jgi:hypothetical protein